MKVVVTGDRAWADAKPISAVLTGLVAEAHAREERLELIHGAAPGVDTLVDAWVGIPGVKVTAVPANWKDLGKRAGPLRNRVMLDMGPELVVAFHDDLEGASRGTQDCVVEAMARDIPVWHLRRL